jgi:uncharacterized protein
MKHILLSLFLALALAATAPAQSIPSQESEAAYGAYATCSSTALSINDCEKEYQQWTAAVTAELRAAMRDFIPKLNAVTAEFNAYVACRANRRWFQIWKRRCTL